MVEAIVAEIIEKSLHGARPPAAPPTHYKLARTIKLAGGRRAGRFYDPDSDACQRKILMTVDSGLFPRVAVCAPPQVGGKTQSLILPATLRAIICSRQLVGYGLPTLEALTKAWNEKIAASIRGSGYGDHLPTKGPGSKGGRPDVVYFQDPITGEREGGIVFMTGGAYGSTVSVVVVDDVDKFEKKGKPDREAVEDILHRADSYREQALRLICGTIEFDIGSLILSIIEDSTDTRPWPSCPHCGVHQVLDFDHFVCDFSTDQTAKQSARYRCDACSVLWTESDRQRAIHWKRVIFCDRGQRVEAGQVVGEPSQSLTFGLTWGALDSAQADMGELGVELRAAKLALARGDHALMRKFRRYRECKPYTADFDEQEAGSELTWQFLLDRSLVCKWGPAIHTSDRSAELAGHLYSRHVAEPPEEAIGCVAGVDVQNDRVYPVLVAFDQAGSTYDVGWSYEYARADHRPWDRGELHALLDRVDVNLHLWSGDLPLIAVGLDVGDFTDDLMPWLGGRRGLWFPTKGQKTVTTGEHPDVPGLIHVNETGLHLLGTNNLREIIHAAYRRPNAETGAAHIPRGLSNKATDRAYLQHLCAERTVVDPKTRKKSVKNGPGRWDWQDARRIAEALIRKHRAGVARPPRKVIQASDWFAAGRRL